MSERQKHGFDFEAKALASIGAIPSAGYTDKWDGMVNGIPVSVKVSKYGGDVEMADYFRNEANTEDFILIVGFWEGAKDNFVETYALYIKGDEWAGLFHKETGAKFKELITTITNSYDDDAKWKASIKELKKEWSAHTSNLIRPRFKRDHKTQKRIQCAINNGDFYNVFLKKYAKNNTQLKAIIGG